MSPTYDTCALAIAILIASAGPCATQEASAPLDVAKIPAAAGAYAGQEIESRRKPPVSRAVPIGIGEILHAPLGLSENSWDFASPDSIPGFGTLPAGYDSPRGPSAIQRRMNAPDFRKLSPSAAG